LRMRWFWPSSSSREYLLMAQNLSLTYVMVPCTSVVATIACWSRAYFCSRSSCSASRPGGLSSPPEATPVRALSPCEAGACGGMAIPALTRRAAVARFTGPMTPDTAFLKMGDEREPQSCVAAQPRQLGYRREGDNLYAEILRRRIVTNRKCTPKCVLRMLRGVFPGSFRE
jgi:hypothetical protein